MTSGEQSAPGMRTAFGSPSTTRRTSARRTSSPARGRPGASSPGRSPARRTYAALAPDLMPGWRRSPTSRCRTLCRDLPVPDVLDRHEGHADRAAAAQSEPSLRDETGTCNGLLRRGVTTPSPWEVETRQRYVGRGDRPRGIRRGWMRSAVPRVIPFPGLSRSSATTVRFASRSASFDAFAGCGPTVCDDDSPFRTERIRT